MANVDNATGSADRKSPSPFRLRRGCALAYGAGWALIVACAVVPGWPVIKAAGVLEWLLAADIDLVVSLALLLIAPIAWRLGTGDGAGTGAGARSSGPMEGWRNWVTRAGAAERGSPAKGAALSLLVAATSWGTSAWTGSHFDALPPAYHDEYSYLFQARTFLAGRVSYPSHEAPRLFDQMHVLNEGRFASRYFPGTGLWLAPFVALGNPWYGQWLAGALAAVLIFWCGRELAGDFAGVVAGLLTALAPGMALFSNLLLAHHPALVGLGLFLLAFLRCIRLESARWAFVAGAGLAFAAVCRPMTAAGVALPFGVYLLIWSLAGGWRAGCARARLRWKVLPAIGAPLLAAGGLMFLYDRAITGNGWETPYALYTEIYTPRHRYGFNNAIRDERADSARVIRKYDSWALNLTPALAAENTGRRLVASWEWTLGLVPLTLAVVAGVSWWQHLNAGTRLTLAGIVSLHAAHVPYWFVGMQDYHYVFESGPLLLLWTASVTVQALRGFSAERRWWMPAWWLGTVAAVVVMNYAVRGGVWSAPLEKGLAEVRFSREKHGRFEALIEQEARPRPALVLVEEDPADRHIEYVNNRPSLDGEILYAHDLRESIPVERVRQLFPERALFVYHAKEGRLERLSGGGPGAP
jgi:hypothetical protein